MRFELSMFFIFICVIVLAFLGISGCGMSTCVKIGGSYPLPNGERVEGNLEVCVDPQKTAQLNTPVMNSAGKTLVAIPIEKITEEQAEDALKNANIAKIEGVETAKQRLEKILK